MVQNWVKMAFLGTQSQYHFCEKPRNTINFSHYYFAYWVNDSENKINAEAKERVYLSTFSVVVGCFVCLLFQSFVFWSLKLGTDVHVSQSRKCSTSDIHLKGIQGHLTMEAQTRLKKAQPKFLQNWKHIICTKITLASKRTDGEKATVSHTGVSETVSSDTDLVSKQREFILVCSIVIIQNFSLPGQWWPRDSVRVQPTGGVSRRWCRGRYKGQGGFTWGTKIILYIRLCLFGGQILFSMLDFSPFLGENRIPLYLFRLLWEKKWNSPRQT